MSPPWHISHKRKAPAFRSPFDQCTKRSVAPRRAREAAGHGHATQKWSLVSLRSRAQPNQHQHRKTHRRVILAECAPTREQPESWTSCCPWSSG